VFIFATLVVIALAAIAGYLFGLRQRAPDAQNPSTVVTAPVSPAPSMSITTDDIGPERVDHEKARIIRSVAGEAFALQRRLDVASGEASMAASESAAKTILEAGLAAAQAETARYRQLVVDIENSAPPPILMGIAEPDDLKLIVGIGPVLERMLRNLGIGTFRQIARWTPRDIAEFDAKLPEFPGRIVRDQWVTQARALHESKYGESPLTR
jgi:predicted flap endonuclease-1-like 5' DNA nuclease